MGDPCETCTEHKLLKSDIEELKETKKYVFRLFVSTVLSIATGALAIIYTATMNRGNYERQENRRPFSQPYKSENYQHSDTINQRNSVRDGGGSSY